MTRALTCHGSPRKYGELCISDGECASQMCFAGPVDRVCTQFCLSFIDCPRYGRCDPIEDSDGGGLCIPNLEDGNPDPAAGQQPIFSGCSKDEHCAGSNSRCIKWNNRTDGFCTRVCNENIDCPVNSRGCQAPVTMPMSRCAATPGDWSARE